MLAKVFPVLEELGPTSGARTHAVADPAEFRNRVFIALREMLGRIAERHPVVVAIDDLQWADPDAFAALRELTAPPAAPPLLVVLAYRAEDIDQVFAQHGHGDRPPGDGRPETQVITLTGLDDRDAANLVTSLTRDGPPLEPDVVVAIVTESGGSPFLRTSSCRASLTRVPSTPTARYPSNER